MKRYRDEEITSGDASTSTTEHKKQMNQGSGLFVTHVRAQVLALDGRHQFHNCFDINGLASVASQLRNRYCVTCGGCSGGNERVEW